MQVMNKCCNQCLMSKNKIVSDDRKSSLLRGIISEQGYFTCHKATISGEEICCRGFYEQLGHTSQMVRIAQRLRAVKFVELKEKDNE